MIINLECSNVNVKKNEEKYLDFEIPMMKLPDNSFVHIVEIIIKRKEKVENILGHITSSLIDRSVVNQNQTLLSFYHNTESDIMFYSPTHIQKYKIQRYQLDSSDFKIQLSEKHQIRNLKLKLVITDARI